MAFRGRRRRRGRCLRCWFGLSQRNLRVTYEYSATNAITSGQIWYGPIHGGNRRVYIPATQFRLFDVANLHWKEDAREFDYTATKSVTTLVYATHTSSEPQLHGLLNSSAMSQWGGTADFVFFNKRIVSRLTNRAPLSKNVKLQLKPCEWLENKLEKCEGKQVEKLQQQQEFEKNSM